MLSVVIPNHNGARTIDRCLEHLLASDHGTFEVIVVDDASTDDSVARIRKHDCRLVRMTERGGASRARNLGALQARGEILLFIDADCLVQADTLRVAEAEALRLGHAVVVGGTYAPRPADPGFFNTFQSVFIHHSETRHPDRPDYIASHAMVIHARTFHEHGGFPEAFLPILEDVEFSHRLRRHGVRLVMQPGLLVRHEFNFNLFRSLANAQRKTRYWVRYSLDNGDLLADSGTASRELKLNAIALVVTLLLILAGFGLRLPQMILAAAFLQLGNAAFQKPLFADFLRTGGPVFAFAAAFYYMFMYPWAIMFGGLIGAGTHFFRKFLFRDPVVKKVRPVQVGHRQTMTLKSSETA